MVRVAVLRGRLDYILFALAVSGSGSSYYPSLPSSFDCLDLVQRSEDVEVQKQKFERSRDYFARRDNVIPQQPKYNRQFGNGGISGRVPYHLKRENYYRSKYK